MRWILAVLYLLSVSGLTFVGTPQSGSPRVAITAENVDQLEKLAQFENGSLDNPIWTPDGQYMYITGSLGLWRFDPSDLTTPPLRFEQYFPPIAFSADNRTAASLDDEGNIVLWDMHTGEFLEQFYEVSQRLIWITDLVFSPDGTQLVMGFGGGTNIRPTGGVTVWNVETRETVIDIRHLVDDPVYLAFDPDGTRLTAGGYNGVHVWETSDWTQILPGIGSYVGSVDINTNGRWVAYWDWRNATPVLIDTTHSVGEVCPVHAEVHDSSNLRGDVAFSPITADVLVVSQSETLTFWDVYTCQRLALLTTPGYYAIAYSPDGTRLAGVSSEGFDVYDTESFTRTDQVKDFAGRLGNFIFSDDGELFAYQRDHAVRVWDMGSFSEIALITSENDLDALTEYPFLQTHVAAPSWDGIEGGSPPFQLTGVVVYDLPAATCSPWTRQYGVLNQFMNDRTPENSPIRSYWQAHSYPVAWLCLSPDQRLLVTADRPTDAGPASADNPISLRVWDVATGEPIAVIDQASANGAGYDDLRFSVDNQYFAAVRGNAGIVIWDTQDWRMVTAIQQGAVQGQFIPHSRVFVSRSENGHLSFWDRDTGVSLFDLDSAEIADFLISPDGARIACLLPNQTIEIWGIPAGD